MMMPNIRQKIILGTAIFMFCFGGIAILSLSNLRQLESELVLVERTDDLRNLILDTRRVEKNFLLYHDEDFYHQGLVFLGEAVTLLDSLASELNDHMAGHYALLLREDLGLYRQLLVRIHESGQPLDADVARLREQGQDISEMSSRIAHVERASILGINNNLRSTLVISMGVVAMVVLLLVVFMSKSILRPLRRVELATHHIADGTFTPLPVRNAHDEVQRVFVALNHMVEQLEKRQVQLVQAQKLSSIGTLASGIAHQLNNPLNNISTSCQLLQESEGGKDDFADHMMDNIHQETLRARDIVKGLLEFSRQQDFSLGVYPLGQAVASAVRLVASQMPSNIVIRQDVADQLLLPLDRQRMQEALLNLLLNAKQAIEPEAGEIRIVARCEGDHVLLEVRDTGIGMDEATRQRIFDPFFSTKEVGQGTGLGLYIVYGIVEQHRGGIDVESAPGKGTTFSIRLPMAPKEAQ